MLKIWSFLAQCLYNWRKTRSVSLFTISQLKKEGEAINQTEIKSIQVRASSSRLPPFHRTLFHCCCCCYCKTPPVVRVRPLVFCIVFRWPDTSDECVEKTHLQQQQHQENGRLKGGSLLLLARSWIDFISNCLIASSNVLSCEIERVILSGFLSN